jgi:anti-anti-sigma factor
MDIDISTHPETGALRLTGALGVYQADAVRKALLDFLATGTDLVLDLAQVASCDAAGAQLLWSVRRTAMESGKTIRFERASQPLRNSWNRLGLAADWFPTAEPCPSAH